MKLMLTLFACMIALATAAPAIAGNGQSVTESLGSVQVGSTNVSPVVSAASPVAAAAPVCVASSCSSSQTAGNAQSTGTSTAESTQSHPVRQSVSKSIGTAQASSTNVSPVVSAAAPVGAAAPTCVASRCSSGQSVANVASSGTTSVGTGTSHAAYQRVSKSAGTVQVGSTNVSPVVSVAAPIGVSAPVCVESGCAADQSVGESRPTGSTTTEGSGETTTVSPATSSSVAPESAAKGTLRGIPPSIGLFGNAPARKRPRAGVFTPVAGPHGTHAASSTGSRNRKRNGHHAARRNGCDFAGMSAGVDPTPTAAGLVPSGGSSMTLLLGLLCGLLGLSSLAQWVRSEARWWIS